MDDKQTLISSLSPKNDRKSSNSDGVKLNQAAVPDSVQAPRPYNGASSRHIKASESVVEEDVRFQGLCSIDRNFLNIILLGFAFMFIFTAFQTCGMVQQNVINSEKNETNGTYTGNGYTSLAVIYIVFAVFNWVAPSIVVFLGAKLSMISGALMYCLFIAQFLYPLTILLYVGSVLVGLGAAVLWTAQGNYFTLNSSEATLGRNSGLFWALLQCSLLWGNIFEYFDLKGTDVISDDKRTVLFSFLLGTSMLGTLLLLLLRKPIPTESSPLVLDISTSEPPSPLNAFLTAVKMMGTCQMIKLSLVFIYTGFELTFFSGVFTTMVGNSVQFGESRKGYIGIAGMLIGTGEIVGGLLFGILGKKMTKYGRDPVVLLGFFTHMIAFFLIFITFSQDSPIAEKDGVGYLPRLDIQSVNVVFAFVSAFLLGFGDSCFNTQLFSILGYIYPDDSASAFGLFKFFQSFSASAAFFYGNYLQLQWQLLVLVITAVMGTICFFSVEWGTRSNDSVRRNNISSYEKIG